MHNHTTFQGPNNMSFRLSKRNTIPAKQIGTHQRSVQPMFSEEKKIVSRDTNMQSSHALSLEDSVDAHAQALMRVRHRERLRQLAKHGRMQWTRGLLF